MNILYLHGFASYVNPANAKYATLRQLGQVVAHAPNYAHPNGLEQVVTSSLQVIEQQPGIDLLVGTSMGGYTASILHQETGIPFVALNPPVSPSQTLQKYLGEGIDLRGNLYTLTTDIVESYVDFIPAAASWVFVNLGDELLCAEETVRFMQAKGVKVTSLAGGTHRFDNLEQIVPHIRTFMLEQALA